MPPATAQERPGRARLRGSLSPSRAADFLTCPLLYRLRAIDRVPEPVSAAAARGTVVHAVLERLFDLPAAERTPDSAAALLPLAWDGLRAREPELDALFDSAQELERWLASARALLQRYFGLEDPQRLEPAERELLVETTLDSGLVLRGYLDRLDVAPSGAMRVVDYKTGRAPGPGFEAPALFQLRFYALVLWRLRGEVPRRLQLMYLGSGEVLRHEPDDADLRATERKVLALWDAIRLATQTGDFRPSPSRRCGFCAHQALCPARGGTPPPFPGLAGEATATPAP
ncbi:PD-(D/E)XK nuclease family protein [Motilibacter sp. K478]|nr:PD-(D/E)XK nuclease family protein [Motilibacter aurantiacus]